MHLVAPSLLAADFGYLARDIEMVNNSKADWFHVDIMDGSFVPNFSIGSPVIEAIKRHAKLPLDVHLMVVEPDKHIDLFANLGASVITVHYEACTHLHRVVQKIKDFGIKAGVSLNPSTPVSLLEEILPDLDLVLIMSVNPGYGGQKFIPGSYNKIRRLDEMKKRLNPDLLIEVDGGVTVENAKALTEAGVNVLVAGNTVFASSNPNQTIESLKNLY